MHPTNISRSIEGFRDFQLRRKLRLDSSILLGYSQRTNILSLGFEMPALILPNHPNIPFAAVLASTSNLCLSYIRPESKFNSPISRIPSGVLSEIFLYVLLSPGPRTLPPRPDTPVISTSNHTSPFPLSNVSKKWRYVINNDARIWSSIVIFSPHPKHFYRTELWLKYSKAAPLEVVITSEGSEAVDEGLEWEATLTILDMLVVHSSRWRGVGFRFNASIPFNVVKAFLAIQQHPKPALQVVGITIGRDNANSAAQVATNSRADTMYKTLQNTPSLCELTWSSPIGTPHMRFGAQLAYIDLSSPITVAELADNLADSPNLVYFSACKVGRSISLNGRKAPILLPRLKALIITLVTPDDKINEDEALTLVPFLCLLTTPSLTELSLQGVADHPDGMDMDVAAEDHNLRKVYTRLAVHELLQRSYCRLHSLNVHIPDAFPVEVQAWMDIKWIEDVEVLCISGCEIDDQVLDTLTWDHSSVGENLLEGKRFPRLTHLGLSRCAQSIDDDVLLRMLGSRFWTPVIPSLSLDLADGDDAKRTKKELCSAHVWVRDLTPNMTFYEKMMNSCAERIRDWKHEGRALEFTLA